jgi:hypothetical protein
MEYEEKLRNNPLADEVKDSYRGLEVTFHKIIEAETAYLLSLNAPAPEEQS